MSTGEKEWFKIKMAIECSCFNVENNSCFQSLTVIKCQLLSLSHSESSDKKNSSNNFKQFLCSVGIVDVVSVQCEWYDWRLTFSWIRSVASDINRESFTELSIPSWNWIFFKTKRLPSLYYSWIYLFSYFIWMIVHIIWITIYPRFAIQLSHLFINKWLIMVISL